MKTEYTKAPARPSVPALKKGGCPRKAPPPSLPAQIRSPIRELAAKAPYAGFKNARTKFPSSRAGGLAFLICSICRTTSSVPFEYGSG